jgi:hypothetical protein
MSVVAEHGCVERNVCKNDVAFEERRFARIGNLSQAEGRPALPTAPLDPGNICEHGDVEVVGAHLTVSQYGISDP